MLNMIKNVKREDRAFWLNKCTTKEIKEVVKNMGIKIYSKQYKDFKKEDWINKLINLLDKEVFEEIKDGVSEDVRELLKNGDEIKDFKTRKFYYEVIKNIKEEDTYIKAITDVTNNYSEEELKFYSKELIRFFHSDTSNYGNTESFMIVKDFFDYVKWKKNEKDIEIEEYRKELREEGLSEEEIEEEIEFVYGNRGN